MNTIDNYKTIIEDIFQIDSGIKISNSENNCISALNNYQFCIFKCNFINRLKRLYNHFKSDEKTIKNILVTLKNIAEEDGYKWSGPYSELIVLDYLISYDNLTNLVYQNKFTKDNLPDSIVKDLGGKEIDFDLSFDTYSSKIYMDVKSFIPTHTELVEKIFEKLREQISTHDYAIGINDLYDVDYLLTRDDYQYELNNKKSNLIANLKNAISNKQSFYEHTLKSGNKAKFKISYKNKSGNMVLSTYRTINPYRLALDYKYKILDYSNKLLKDKPSFIAMVINPWFNNELNNFDDFNQKFYRALSRRVFCELSNNNNLFGDKKIKIADIAKLISGIIFIEDYSITNTNNEIYKAYIYLNPNSANSTLKSNDIIDCLDTNKYSTIIDDFIYDNY